MVKYLDLYQLEVFVWDEDDPAHVTTFVEIVETLRKEDDKVDKIKGIFKALDKSYDVTDYDEDGVEIDCPCNVGKLAAVLDACEIFNTNNKESMLPSQLVQDDEMQEAIKDLLDLNKVKYTETKNRYRVKDLGGLGVEVVLYKNGEKFIFKIPKNIPGFTDLVNSLGLDKNGITMGDDMAYVECYDLDTAAEIFETILEYDPKEEQSIQQQVIELLQSIKFEVNNNLAVRQLNNIIVELNLNPIISGELGIRVYYDNIDEDKLPKIKNEFFNRIAGIAESHAMNIKYSSITIKIDKLSKALTQIFDFDKDIDEIINAKDQKQEMVNKAIDYLLKEKFRLQSDNGKLAELEGNIANNKVTIAIDKEQGLGIMRVPFNDNLKNIKITGITAKKMDNVMRFALYKVVDFEKLLPQVKRMLGHDERELLVNNEFKDALQLLKENGYEVSEDESYATHSGNVITVDMDCNKDGFTAYISPRVGLKEDEIEKLKEVMQGNLKNEKVAIKVMSSGLQVAIPLKKLKDVMDIFTLTNKTFINFLQQVKSIENKETKNDGNKEVKTNVSGTKYQVHKGDIALNILPPMKKGQIWHRTRIIKSIFVGVDDIIEEMDFEVLSVLKSGKVKCKNLSLGIEFKLIPEKTNHEDTYFLVKDIEEQTKKEPKKVTKKVEDAPVIEKEPKLQPNKVEEIPTKTRKGDLIGRVFDLKFKKTGEEDHDDAIDRILAYIKKNQKILKTRNDLGIWLLDSPKELAKYKLEFPAVVLMFYGDMTADMVKKDFIYNKFHKSKALSVIRHPFKTKDLNGVPVMAAVFYDNKTAVKYHLKLIKESMENNCKIELNGVEFKVLALNESTIEIQSNSGITLEVLIESLNIPMQDDLDEE